MKKSLSILLAIIFAINLNTQAEDFSAVYNGVTIYYNITSSTLPLMVEVTNQEQVAGSYSGSVLIPDSVLYGDNYFKVTSIGGFAFSGIFITSITIPNSVTSISDYAFYGCRGLTSLTIPNSVTSIGQEAFSNCDGLTSITIGNSVTSIGDYAFYVCTELTTITIPNSVTSIGNYAFYGCSGLTSIIIPNSVTLIGDYAFINTPWYNNIPDGVLYVNNVLYKYKGTMPANTTINIQTGTTRISGDAFAYCSGLTSITIPNSVNSIGGSAFNGCSGLTSITIPNSVISIGHFAFYNCSGLTSIIIPNSVTSIGSSSFEGCSRLSSITIGDSVTSIGSNAFYGCYGLYSITIPNSVTSIGSYAFEDTPWYDNKPDGVVYINNILFKYKGTMPINTIINVQAGTVRISGGAFSNCSGLTSITIPNSVTSIGDGAFYGCSGLTSITIPNSVTSIGDGAFENCTGLTSITIPNSVISIRRSAFRGCSGLTSITIPNSVTSISDDAFRGCSGLTSITIPNSVTSIGSGAFSGCSGLTSITIPNSVTTIGNNAFSYCTGLTSITIPNSVTLIGGGAFGYCTGLTSITIPNSVTLIDSYAFSDCSGLTSITIPNSIILIRSNAFSDCSGLTSITIPTSIISISASTFRDCTSITSIVIPSSVRTIGNYAFKNCNSLDTMYFNAFNCNSIGNATRTAFEGCNNFKTLFIGDSVQNIPSRAFFNCSSLTSIISKVINPPSIQSNSFSGVSKTIPLYVTCNSIPSYQSALYWSEFTNYVGARTPLYISTSICEGSIYSDYGANIDSAGVYTLVNGCDSIILTLSVTPSYIINYYDNVCSGVQYSNYGFSFVSDTNGIYRRDLQAINGCDSIVNLTLTVNQPALTNLTAEICQGEVYTLNGFNVSTAGLHTQNLQTIKGCDSTVNLTLTVNQPAIANLTAEICQGEVYTLNGFNASTVGLHTLNLQTTKGCDSTVNLTLTVNQPAITNLTAEICQGEVYTLNGFNVNTAGLHTLNLQTYKGCDSTVNLTLTINQPATTNLSAEICQGEVYTLNGFNVSTAGLHTQNLQTVKGCDSTVNLTLNVNQPATTNLSAEICQGEVYTFNGFNVSTPGLHTLNLQTTKGCDSTVNLTLTINQPAITNLTAEICQGDVYTLNGFNVSTAGLHTLNLQTIKGCDSTVNLILTVNQPAITNLTAEICQGDVYTLNGFYVNTAGLHTQNLQTTKGCDSTVNLTLTVNQPAITNLTAEICQGETYTLNGFNVNTAGLHTQNLQTIKGCDSIVNLTLIVNPVYLVSYLDNICKGYEYNNYGFNFIADTSGVYTRYYQTINGCDSVFVLNLVVNPTPIVPEGLDVQVRTNFIELNWQDNGSSYVIYRNNDSLTTTTMPIYLDYDVVNNQPYCYKVKSINGDCESEFTNMICKTYLGIDNIQTNNITTKLYPNPTEGKAKLEIEGLSSEVDVLVYDMIGRVIQTHKIYKGKNELEIDLNGYAKGVYSIRIMNDNINQTKKLIVQ